MNLILWNDSQFAKFCELIESDPEHSDEQKAEMLKARLESELIAKEKAGGLAGYCLELEARAGVIDTEIERLQARKKAWLNRSEAIKIGVRDWMLTKGIEKIEFDSITVALRDSEAVKDIVPEDAPEEYRRTKTTVSLDKVAIKKAVKDGKLSADQWLDVRTSLVIK